MAPIGKEIIGNAVFCLCLALKEGGYAMKKGGTIAYQWSATHKGWRHIDADSGKVLIPITTIKVTDLILSSGESVDWIWMPSGFGGAKLKSGR